MLLCPYNLSVQLKGVIDVGDRLSTGQQKIRGYRDMTAGEIATINAIKDMAADVGSYVRILEADLDGDGYDQRWVAIAKTHLQQGFMAMVRAVAKPEGF